MAGSSESSKHAHVLFGEDGAPTIDRPWIFRTYAGHTSARASNQLFRQNLGQGQTGLSIAFDLPTQCGYASDHPLARPEVGKVGVPINTLDDFHLLFDGIELTETNTSMTINGTAMWLLALYLALARERGDDFTRLRGTTQNDIIKEYLARGTYIFPPDASMRLSAELYEYCLEHVPQWNPSNICSYHLQEAGATPVQELAYSLVTAIGLLDLLRERGRVAPDKFGRLVGRISFFVNGGIRFIEEMCKMRAFVQLWDEVTRTRYGVEDPRQRRFRYGVQVNSLNLTEAQPENNAWRILVETLGVLLSRGARCRALQLPCWNEALSLPRPWDQQWSLRLQQILAHETDLLEYPDLFEGSPVVTSKVAALVTEARAEIHYILGMGGVRAGVDSGYMKAALVRSMADRMSRIASGEQVVVGVNRWGEGLPSPLRDQGDGGVFHAPADHAHEALASLERARAGRDAARAQRALAALRTAAERGDNLVEPSIECALSRVTTGEWADALRGVFGEYRAATGVEGQTLRVEDGRLEGVRERVHRLAERTRPPPAPGGGQARPRRSLQRRRGHRGVGARRRLRRHLRGHPPDPGRDRAQRGRGRGRSHRAVDPVGLAPGAVRPGHGAARGGRRRARDPGGGRRHRAAGRRRAPDRARRAAGVHPGRLPRPRRGRGAARHRRGARAGVSAAEADRVRALLARDKRAIGRALSLCEDTRAVAAGERARLLAALAGAPGRRRAYFAGVTGPPGAGKSTLIAEIAMRLVGAGGGGAAGSAGSVGSVGSVGSASPVGPAGPVGAASRAGPVGSVAVLAVDPTSAASGGALLGDWVRVRFPPGDDRLFFRSQSSALELGGLGRHTFTACRLLQHLFELVVVETVGVGQSEIDVSLLADRTYLILPPHFGDAVQLMKAGVMEIPDAVLLSKQDLPGAAAGAGALAVALGGGVAPGGRQLPLHRVSAHTGEGLDGVVSEIAQQVAKGPAGPAAPLARREPHFFRRWVQSEWGRSGLEALDGLGGAAAYLAGAGSFDAACAGFVRDYRTALASRPVD